MIYLFWYMVIGVIIASILEVLLVGRSQQIRRRIGLHAPIYAPSLSSIFLSTVLWPVALVGIWKLAR